MIDNNMIDCCLNFLSTSWVFFGVMELVLMYHLMAFVFGHDTWC